MKLIPFQEFNDIKFGISENDVIAKFGPPKRSELKSDNTELTYNNCTIRIGENTGLVKEITAKSEYFIIENEEIGFAELGYFVGKRDAESFQAHGFIISPKYGIAFDPHCRFWLTANSKSDFKGWLEFDA